MDKNNVIIISHRRSGTHLTIDAIRENFFEGSDYLNIDSFIDIPNRKFDRESFVEKAVNFHVFKTHLLPDLTQYITNENDIDFLNTFIDSAKKVYVERDGRDVMVSLYHYMQNFDKSIQNMGFSDFLKTVNKFDPFPPNMSRPKFWKYHVQQWSEKNDILYLKYNKIINEYSEVLSKVSKQVDIPLNTYIDVRLSSKSKFSTYLTRILIKLKLNRKNSAVGFRKGTINDFENYFSDGDLEFYNTEVNENTAYK